MGEDTTLFDPAADVEGSEVLPLNGRVPCMLLWKDSIKLCSLDRQPKNNLFYFIKKLNDWTILLDSFHIGLAIMGSFA